MAATQPFHVTHGLENQMTDLGHVRPSAPHQNSLLHVYSAAWECAVEPGAFNVSPVVPPQLAMEGDARSAAITQQLRLCFQYLMLSNAVPFRREYN